MNSAISIEMYSVNWKKSCSVFPSICPSTSLSIHPLPPIQVQVMTQQSEKQYPEHLLWPHPAVLTRVHRALLGKLRDFTFQLDISPTNRAIELLSMCINTAYNLSQTQIFFNCLVKDIKRIFLNNLRKFTRPIGNI